MPCPKIHHAPTPSNAAAAGTASIDHHSTSMPSKTRAGSHAINPTGTIVTKPANTAPESPSSGNGANCVSNCHVDEFTSSAARGAQNASAPQAYSNASTISIDATTCTTNTVIQIGETCKSSSCPASTRSSAAG